MTIVQVLSTTEPKSVRNALRLGNTALAQGDSVGANLPGKAVELGFEWKG